MRGSVVRARTARSRLTAFAYLDALLAARRGHRAGVAAAEAGAAGGARLGLMGTQMITGAIGVGVPSAWVAGDEVGSPRCPGPTGPGPSRAWLGPGYATATPGTLQRRFLDSSGTISVSGDTITVRIDRRVYSPVLRQTALPPDTTVPGGTGAASTSSSANPGSKKLHGNRR